jgi:hypothetical protein
MGKIFSRKTWFVCQHFHTYVSVFPRLCVSISTLMCQHFHAYVSAFPRLLQHFQLTALYYSR